MNGTVSFSGKLSDRSGISGKMSSRAGLNGELGGYTHHVPSSYEDLNNLPQIEGVTLTGDKTYEDLNLNRMTNTEIEEMLRI